LLLVRPSLRTSVKLRAALGFEHSLSLSNFICSANIEVQHRRCPTLAGQQAVEGDILGGRPVIVLMELRHIRYFLAVAAERNFGRAAERVGIGQPPLSLQIRDLEREVGARLFHRIPQGVSLTAAGKAFHDAVRNIPEQVDRATRISRRAARGEVGALSLGYVNSAALNPIFAAALGSYRRTYPDVALSLKDSHTTQLIKGLRDGEFDVAYVRPGEADAEGIKTRVISEEPLMAVLPSAHPEVNSLTLRLADLHADSFILNPREDTPSVFDATIEACREAGFEPTLGPSVPQLVTVLHLVAAGLGVSLMAASLQALQVKGIVFKTIHDVSPITRLALAWRRTDTSPFLMNFLSLVFTGKP
jgi:DNA-binding transcriptional LysR family regulator